MRQIWRRAQQAHDRLGLVWFAGWSLPLAVLSLAFSVPLWRAAIDQSDYAMAQQIDYEDTALCVRFGFAAGTENHFACKLDLLELRRNHESLLAAGSLP